MILDIRTGKAVESMDVMDLEGRVRYLEQVDLSTAFYATAYRARHGRWDLTYVDGGGSFAWGDDLIFFPLPPVTAGAQSKEFGCPAPDARIPRRHRLPPLSYESR